MTRPIPRFSLSDPSKDGDPANGDLTHNPLRQDVS
jgi:hypothetical protein